MQVTWGQRLRSLSLLVATAWLISLGGAPASAHAQLLSSTPAAGATVQTPATVTLVFNEALIEAGTEISAADATGTVTVLTPTYPEPATVAVDLPRLADGAAAVTWRVVSADGHPIEGVLEFVVANPVETSPDPSPEPSRESVVTPSPAPTLTPINAPGDGTGLPGWLWAALAAAVLAAAALAVAARRR